MSTSTVKVWTKLLGSSGSDNAKALTTGLDGSIYVSGSTTGALDGQTNSGSSDAFLTKYSVDGTKVWTRLLGTSGYDGANALTTGLDGSIYIAGYTVGALDGQTNSGNVDAFLTKYSADGTKAWTKLLGTSGAEIANALTTGLDGSIYVSGYTGGALDGQTYSGSGDAFLTKYSADGTKAWTKLLGSSGYEAATALTTDLDGSIYVSGQTNGALDGQTQTINYGADSFLTKYSADGTKAWTKLLGSSRYDYAYALTAGLDGSIYVAGYTNGSLDGQTNSGDYDAFLTKYSTDGTKVWTKLLGSSGADYAYALTTGLDGSIYIAGDTSGALDGQTNSGSNDAFLTKYSADGTKAWTKLLGSSGGGYPAALTTGLDGSIYIAADTSGALDGQTNSGGYDAFLVKFSEVVDPTYSLASNASSVNEGASASFTLTTTSVASGTSVPYTLTGVSAADITGGLLAGSATVNSSGIATISVGIVADSLTEGAETLTVTAQSKTASVTINDTSIAAAEYQLNGSSTFVNEGGFTEFTLYTKNVTIGTVINYSISGTGITSSDIVGGSLAGTAVVASTSFNGFTGGATIYIYSRG